MKLATFNVNGINARTEILCDWLKSAAPDALAIQETKTVDAGFPAEVFKPLGYESFFFGQKSYNGVAILVKKDTFKEAKLLTKNIPNYPDDSARAIAVELTEKDGTSFAFIGGYFPNGQEVGSDKYLYKLDWIASLTEWTRHLLAEKKSLALAGDFNIAPTDNDVWNPEEWKDCILVSAPERDAYTGLKECGLIDLWEKTPHDPQTYSWWDYRQQGFEKNHGMRIDHIFASAALASRLQSITVDTTPRTKERPSDHTPIVATFL
jgi:exodeoxyribonuclease III